MKKISTNIITVKYMIALCLLAVLAFASFNILLENIKAHERDAAIVNLSGRQRMLSQRIALKAYQLTNPGAMSENAALRSELQNAIHLMEASHNALIHGDSDLGIPGSPSSAVQSMIFSGPVSLDSIVSDYIGKAKEVLDSSGSDSHEVTTNLDSLTLKSNEILAALDAVVHQYQLESESANAQLKHIETLILISFLLVLLLLALFIFRPMVNQIKREARDLERAEKYSRTIMEMVADGLIIINDQGIMKSFNHSAELIFGYSSSDVLEKNIDMLIPEHYCNKHTASFYAYLQENTPKDGPIFEHEVEGMRKDGSAVPLALSVSEIKHDNRRLFISSVRDITKRKEMEEQLRKTAITDELTGLFNRRGFFTLSEKYCKLAKRNQRKMFLL